MTEVSDEMLNAYVDGALDSEAQRKVEAYLERDADARAYVEALRQVNALSPAAMDALLGPVPQDLIDTIHGASAAASGHNVVQIGDRRPRKSAALPVFGGSSAIAAALALCVVTAVGYLLLAPHMQQGSAGDLIAAGPVTPGSPVAQLLEAANSGMTADINPGAPSAPMQATVLATFKDGKGRFCRELEVARRNDPAAVHSASIACRVDDATWVVEGSVALAAIEAGGDTYVPSGSAHDEPLAPLVRSLALGKALSSEEERTAVASRWAR